MQTTRVATGRLRRRAAAAFLVTALGVAGGGPAHGAEPKAGSKEAKHAEAVAHFEKGKKLGEIGRYEDSVKEFEESYLLEPVPEILLNIALSHRFMKHYDKAIELYGRYIKMRPDAPNRKEIEKLMGDLAHDRDAAAAGVASGTGTGGGGGGGGGGAAGGGGAGTGGGASGGGTGKGGGGAGPEPPAPTTGRVALESDPPGAVVSLAGASLGITPVAIELPQGSHIIRFELPGYVAREMGVYVEAGRPVTVAAALVPMGSAAPALVGSGRLTVTTNLPGAEVRLDGVAFGYLPLDGRPVPAGEHRLSLLAPGFADREINVIVSPDVTAEMRVDMTPADERSLNVFEGHREAFLASGLNIEAYRRLRTGRAHFVWGVGLTAVSGAIFLATLIGAASSGGAGPGVFAVGTLIWVPPGVIGAFYVYGGRKKVAHAKKDRWDRPYSVTPLLPAPAAAPEPKSALYGLPPAGGAGAEVGVAGAGGAGFAGVTLPLVAW